MNSKAFKRCFETLRVALECYLRNAVDDQNAAVKFVEQPARKPWNATLHYFARQEAVTARSNAELYDSMEIAKEIEKSFPHCKVVRSYVNFLLNYIAFEVKELGRNCSFRVVFFVK
jgi:hypothetical protein